jgi:hypothetical protein
MNQKIHPEPPMEAAEQDRLCVPPLTWRIVLTPRCGSGRPCQYRIQQPPEFFQGSPTPPLEKGGLGIPIVSIFGQAVAAPYHNSS